MKVSYQISKMSNGVPNACHQCAPCFCVYFVSFLFHIWLDIIANPMKLISFRNPFILFNVKRYCFRFSYGLGVCVFWFWSCIMFQTDCWLILFAIWLEWKGKSDRESEKTFFQQITCRIHIVHCSQRKRLKPMQCQ